MPHAPCPMPSPTAEINQGNKDKGERRKAKGDCKE